MNGVVLEFSKRARGAGSFALSAWSVAMTVVVFIDIVASSALVTLVGFAVSALYGVYLGWRRRVATVFFAPLVNWTLAWFPTEIASMIHFGILKGFFLGLLLITVGWAVIGFVEFLWVGMVAVFVRSLRGRSRGEPVVVFGPDGR